MIIMSLFIPLFPSTSIDFSISDGVKEIMIEERDPEEVTTYYRIGRRKDTVSADLS